MPVSLREPLMLTKREILDALAPCRVPAEELSRTAGDGCAFTESGGLGATAGTAALEAQMMADFNGAQAVITQLRSANVARMRRAITEKGGSVERPRIRQPSRKEWEKELTLSRSTDASLTRATLRKGMMQVEAYRKQKMLHEYTAQITYLPGEPLLLAPNDKGGNSADILRNAVLVDAFKRFPDTLKGRGPSVVPGGAWAVPDQFDSTVVFGRGARGKGHYVSSRLTERARQHGVEPSYEL